MATSPTKAVQVAAGVGSGGVAASIGRNTLFGVISNLFQVATRLVTIPIVIHHLGIGGYGIWNIVMVAATYMRFGSVGVKNAFQKYVADATGTGDYDQAARLLTTGCAVMAILSIAVLIPAALLSRHIAVAAGVPPEFLHSAAGAIALLAMIMMMSNVGAAFEAIIMGGHRIDLVRKFTSVLAFAEAFAIVVVLHYGGGILSMAAVMGTSELIYIVACYFTSHRVVPELRLGRRWITTSVLYELFRFAGSFQLVNYLEVLYASIVPVAVLRGFGADSAGVYALVTRIVTSASVLLNAFGPSLISGGALVYASGDGERIRRLLTKAFKVTFAVSFLSMSLVAAFGTTVAYAWTGATDPRFQTAFLLVCFGSVCQSLSGISLLLYRVAGKAMLDNLRQVLRIAVLLLIVLFASRLGFSGTLSGLTIAELVGMAFMLFVLARTFKMFRMRELVSDAGRIVGAAVLIITAGLLASYIPLPGNYAGRGYAALKLVEIGIACAFVTWPALRGTGSMTREESQALLSPFLPARGQ